MKLDDTHPDYFVDDEQSQPAPQTQPAATDGDQTAATDGGRTISFDTTPAAGAGNGTSGPDAPRRHSRWRRVLFWFITVVVIVLAVAVYFRYFSPYVEDGRMKCYVINVEKRGMIFKTFEADVVSENALTDTIRLYSRDMSFSVPDQRLARELQQVQGTGRLVTVEYETYNATVPWRGASKSVITAAQIQQ